MKLKIRCSILAFLALIIASGFAHATPVTMLQVGEFAPYMEWQPGDANNLGRFSPQVPLKGTSWPLNLADPHPLNLDLTAGNRINVPVIFIDGAHGISCQDILDGKYDANALQVRSNALLFKGHVVFEPNPGFSSLGEPNSARDNGGLELCRQATRHIGFLLLGDDRSRVEIGQQWYEHDVEDGKIVDGAWKDSFLGADLVTRLAVSVRGWGQPTTTRPWARVRHFGEMFASAYAELADITPNLPIDLYLALGQTNDQAAVMQEAFDAKRGDYTRWKGLFLYQGDSAASEWYFLPSTVQVVQANTITPGDLIGTGGVHADSVNLLLRYNLGIAPLQRWQLKAADWKKNGVIDLGDSILELRYWLGIWTPQ